MNDRRENLWLRELLTLVAQDLEHLAIQAPEPARTTLLTRAMRIRQRMHDGPPADWAPTRLGDSEREVET